MLGMCGIFKIYSVYNINYCLFSAFSMFAVCEYVIALTNMAFHVSVIMDFPTEQLIIAKGLTVQHFESSKLKKID